MRRKFGLGGGGRRKASCEGGGEGVESNAIVSEAEEPDDIAAGIIGNGEFTRTGRSRSISGISFDREAASVLSWKRPTVFLPGSSDVSSDESGSSETMRALRRGCIRAEDSPFFK